MEEKRKLSTVIPEVRTSRMVIVDDNNYLIANGTSEKAKENIVKVYGHLEVLRVGKFDNLTSIKVKRYSWG